jgi:hypothetical protein
MSDGNQALRDTLMTRYVRQVHEDVSGEKLSMLDVFENDFASFANHKAEDDVPMPRRKHLLNYTEAAYIAGAESWDKMSDMFLADANRVLALASDILRKTQ